MLLSAAALQKFSTSMRSRTFSSISCSLRDLDGEYKQSICKKHE
jgi:hypothetical protein